MIQDISKRTILGFASVILVSCSDTAIYNGQEVKILGDSCSSNPPHSCYKLIQLPDGKKVEVPEDKLQF